MSVTSNAAKTRRCLLEYFYPPFRDSLRATLRIDPERNRHQKFNNHNLGPFNSITPVKTRSSAAATITCFIGKLRRLGASVFCAIEAVSIPIKDVPVFLYLLLLLCDQEKIRTSATYALALADLVSDSLADLIEPAAFIA
jgi:hypothetical protein